MTKNFHRALEDLLAEDDAEPDPKAFPESRPADWIPPLPKPNDGPEQVRAWIVRVLRQKIELANQKDAVRLTAESWKGGGTLLRSYELGDWQRFCAMYIIASVEIPGFLHRAVRDGLRLEQEKAVKDGTSTFWSWFGWRSQEATKKLF
ncbi:hypothetical protein LTR66_001984 [Elasticomyces elasticus]|nr:hypothetical protein LTR28_007976 [Elasticomyces elasticus]KAK4998886.1 hypothetical protein LTR66_001984 [Elasticomyces elasticus]